MVLCSLGFPQTHDEAEDDPEFFDDPTPIFVLGLWMCAVDRMQGLGNAGQALYRLNYILLAFLAFIICHSIYSGH